jgi:prepilin-type N-terminal cleavage/methylation domain-containing protein/prepilin-type processing-associated H-X9-DG protein
MRREPAILDAFTLVELLISVAIIALLAGLLLPAVSKAKAKVRSIRCVANLNQLQFAALSYAHDHDERFIPNTSRSIRLIQQGTAPSWVLGNPKWDTNTANLKGGLLFPYVNETALYRCPSDDSQTASRASRIARNRSYSLNGWLYADIVGKGLNVHPQYRPGFKSRLGDIHAPAPVQVFGFIDENEQSIDDGVFASHDPVHWSDPNASPDLTSWMELPSDRHNRGCILSFLDGHVEPWRWEAPKIFHDYDQPPADAADKKDLQRLQAALPQK